MNFDFSEDQHEIRRNAKDMLAKRSSMAKVREAAESKTYDSSLWTEFAELGWPGVAISEDYDGGGLGMVELASLIEESGYSLAGTPFFASAACGLAIQEAGSDEQKQQWLPGLASGELKGSFGVEGALFPDGAEADVIVSVSADGSSAVVGAASAFEVEAVDAIDPTRRYARVSGGGSDALPGDVGNALALVAIITSAELVGISQRNLEMTVEYVKDRKQFGKPVGSFQAVQHRTAQMLLHTEGAKSATYFAAWAADADRDRLAEGAALAKAAASNSGIETGNSAIQSHGGIGFTWEADVHWLYKRAQMDAAYVGGAKTHRAKLTELAAAKIAA